MNYKKTQNIWHPMSIQGNLSPLKIARAEGDFLFTDSGEPIIDAISSWWTCIHGHRHPEIMQAIRLQTENLDHVIFAGFTHEPAEKLASLILDTMNGSGDGKSSLRDREGGSRQFSKVFFSDNGSNSVEIAVKIAHQFYKNRNQGNDSKRSTFVRFSLSYHGDSIGTMSLGGESVFTRIFRELSFPTVEFASPNCRNCPWGKSVDTCRTECLDDFRKYLDESASVGSPDSTHSSDSVTGVILEPLINGANGMVFSSEKFLKELRRITREKNIFLILDEVFTGLYRTGEWYAFAKAEIQPDIVCLAKGLTGGTLPLAVTVVTEEIFSEFETPDPIKAFYHGHTMTGNPLACSAAVASMEILSRDGKNLLTKLESYLRSRGTKLQSALPERIRDLRVMGAVLAFEVNQDLGPDEYLNPMGRKIRNACLERGLLIRPLGNTVYLTPSYHTKDSVLDRIFSILEEVLQNP